MNNAPYITINGHGKIMLDDGIGHIELQLTKQQLLNILIDASKALREMENAPKTRG